MGVNLVLKYKDKTWALYRSHNYKLDNAFVADSKDWDQEYNNILHRIQSRMSSQLGYMPKNAEELENMTYDNDGFTEDIFEDVLKLGKIQLLFELKEEGFTYGEE